MSLLGMFDDEQKRQMFFASVFLSFIFILACLFKLFLWLLTGFLVICSIYLAYHLFGRKAERNRLKEAFGLANGKSSGKRKVKIL